MILFRRLDNPPMPGAGVPRWQVEYYDDEYPDTGYPHGMAWVGDYRPKVANPEYNLGVSVLFVLVPDEYRRRGIGRLLIAACKERWPELWLTEGISEAGEALVVAAERDFKANATL